MNYKHHIGAWGLYRKPKFDKQRRYYEIGSTDESQRVENIEFRSGKP